jgi:hypothetical protein
VYTSSSNWDYASNTATYTSNAISTTLALATWASNAASNGSYASNTLNTFYNTTSGTIRIGTGVNTWTMEVNTTDLEFVSLGGTLVTFSDNFTSSVLNFTGSHKCAYNFSNADNALVGMIVIASGTYNNLDGMTTLDVSEAVPVVDLVMQPMDKRVFGVIAGFDDGLQKPTFAIGNMMFSYGKAMRRVVVNSTGEGAILVCNITGDVNNGDLLTSSFIPGLGMRQMDDIVRSYTIAKVTCDVHWDDVDSLGRYVHGWSNFGSFAYIWALVGCVYMM